MQNKDIKKGDTVSKLEFDITKLKMIHDLNTMMSLNIKDVMEQTGLWQNVRGKLKHQEHKKKLKPTTKVFSNNTCTCVDCGFHANDPLEVAKHYKGGNFAEAIQWLSETFNVSKIPNPEHIPPKGTEQSWNKMIANYKPAAPIVPIVETKKKEFIMTHDVFDAKKTREADTDKGYKIHKTLPYANRLMLIYTDIYNFSMKQDRKEMNEYFSERKINTSHSALKELGFIPVSKFDELTAYLKQRYSLDDLVEVRVLNDSEHTRPNSFYLHYIKKGGVIAYPSFHKYQYNLVTGFMFRPTQPEKWMIDKHMKEIQLSVNDIYETLPYGFTNSFITATNAIKCVVEGGPDAHCCPEKINGKDLLFISSPGAGNLKEQQLGLLKGQTLRFMLDPDKAGEMGVYGYISINSNLIDEHKFPRNKKGLNDCKAFKQKLESDNTESYEVKHDGAIHKCLRAGVFCEVCSWDENYGDLNNIRKHIANKAIPFSSIEEFLTKAVIVTKIPLTTNCLL